MNDPVSPAIPTSPGRELIYQSSNGDSWFLTRESTTGGRIVMHVPNPQSGGTVSHIGLDKFLSEGASGPEHQALRHLIETGLRVATILIAYDIHPFRGAAYDDLIHAIQSLGAWWHHLETVWIVRSGHTPDEIRDHLKSLIGTDDQLLVVDISGDRAGWAGVSDAGSKWLNENIASV